MTREEKIAILKDIIDGEIIHPQVRKDVGIWAIKALEQEPKAVQFAKWVTTEIFEEKWEYNKDTFAEIACRKLIKLGIVKATGDEWELVESPESEDKK